MKANEDKCHLFIIKNNEGTVKLGNEEIIADTSIKLLGLNIDNQLDFKEHITKLLKKGNQKFHVLARISKYRNEQKLKILMRAFITNLIIVLSYGCFTIERLIIK